MFYEIIRTVVQKVLQDKILLGLVIVGFLGIFVGGMTMGDDKPDGAKKDKEATASAEKSSDNQAGAASSAITPKLAADFVGWWLGTAMDYNAATAMESHNQAVSWMTEEAAKGFQASFWTPQIAQAVQTGQLVAAFQPVGVQAQAVNPDGSVVVGVSGTMVVQAGGQPLVRQYAGSFLVRQEKDGLRVAGVDTRSGSLGSF